MHQKSSPGPQNARDVLGGADMADSEDELGGPDQAAGQDELGGPDQAAGCVEETAGLLGVSRMTVTRLVEDGRLPSVIIRRGKVQRTRRIPRAYIERIVADAGVGMQVDLDAHTAARIAEHLRSGDMHATTSRAPDQP